MNSKDLVANYLTDNSTGMRDLITWFLNEVMQREAEDLAGARRYERIGSRRSYRNGTRSRSLKSRYGSLSLNKPLLRDIPFRTQVFERYSRVEKALENAIIESYLQASIISSTSLSVPLFIDVLGFRARSNFCRVYRYPENF
jgi:transposase-like protein